MAINVTCSSCLTRFTVNDKFAGKSGPCPKCKKTIKIPEKSDEVVIHAPEDDGPKDSKGKSVLKPIRRKETKVGAPAIIGASVTCLVAIGVAVALRGSGQAPPKLLVAAAAFLLALPLTLVGYWFLRDDELDGFRGQSLWSRVGICSLVFAITWALYAFIPAYVFGYDSLVEMGGIQMGIGLLFMVAIGTTAAIMIFELEVAQGLMHYVLYFVLTFFLAWLAGSPLSAALPGNAAPSPSVTQPTAPQPPNSNAPSPPEKDLPNLLQ